MKRRYLFIIVILIIISTSMLWFLSSRNRDGEGFFNNSAEQNEISEETKLMMRQYDSLVSLRIQLIQLLALQDSDLSFDYQVSMALDSIIALFDDETINSTQHHELNEDYVVFMNETKSDLEKIMSDTSLNRTELAQIAAEATNLSERYRITLSSTGLQLPLRYLQQ